ncbi:MAG: response regulator [Treponemataceae bacterium]|nr:response regulator [Treponemataceae bacterium]
MENNEVSIVICEDEHIVAIDIKRHLERYGYRVGGIFSKAEEAIEFCEQEKPHLVLMDIQLQGTINGLEASRIIYTHFHIPVVILTAYTDELFLSQIKESFPFGYIVKPFEDRELRTVIELALYRHDMELRLQRSEERYRKLFEEAPTANFIATIEGLIVDCNTTFLNLIRTTKKEELRGTSLYDFVVHKGTLRQMIDSLKKEGIPLTKEIELIPQGREALSVLMTLSVFLDPFTEEQTIQGYVVDMTSYKELESQLLQAQKMEALGRLAGGIAHDFNNIITAIMGYSNLLLEEIKDNPLLKEEVNGIVAASQRAVSLTRQLLTFSRKQPVEHQLIDVHQGLETVRKMIDRLIPETIRLTYYLEAQSPYISLDPGQFEQVIINLVVNARDAIDGEGVIIIETANVHCDGTGSPRCLAPGDWVRISVKDNGCGIPRENLSHIFEPFFTTKKKNNGTGLGLSTVYAIVTKNGGHITVDSTVGKGTVFSLYFPHGASGTSLVLQEPPIEKPEPHTGTILLVEDDDFLRSLIARLLVKWGYRVVEATNAGEALLLAEKEKTFILVTDVVMPHMGGYELAERLIKEHPDLKVLFISGYENENKPKELSLFTPSTHFDFLQKPFSHEELLKRLSQLEKA